MGKDGLNEIYSSIPMVITRFAPSPTGYLHLGHAYSALCAYQVAMNHDGKFLLRIEDIDHTRCRAEYDAALLEDLAWLGLKWPHPVRRQSHHMPDYANALEVLRQRNLIYPCFCTRKDLQEQAQYSATAPHTTDASILYAGTCRTLSPMERADMLATARSVAWRLNCATASKECGVLFWLDRNAGQTTAQPELFGDVVLARKDCAASYHLCVTLDDAIQGISLVTRGKDLFQSTHVHRLLQALLNLPTPEYAHHPLLLDTDGQRFAKRNKSVTLRAMREAGYTPENILALLENHKKSHEL